MSRKDYIEIAEAIREMRKQHPDGKEIIELFTAAIAVRLQKDNPRFSMQRFWDYIER